MKKFLKMIRRFLKFGVSDDLFYTCNICFQEFPFGWGDPAAEKKMIDNFKNKTVPNAIIICGECQFKINKKIHKKKIIQP